MSRVEAVVTRLVAKGLVTFVRRSQYCGLCCSISQQAKNPRS
jgi:hypothetical protein